MPRAKDPRRILRYRIQTGGKTGVRLVPYRKKRVKKLKPEDQPATKGDIQKLAEIADWPPQITRDKNGLKFREAYNQLTALMQSSNPDKFGKAYIRIMDRLYRFGKKYKDSLGDTRTNSESQTDTGPFAQYGEGLNSKIAKKRKKEPVYKMFSELKK